MKTVFKNTGPTKLGLLMAFVTLTAVKCGTSDAPKIDSSPAVVTPMAPPVDSPNKPKTDSIPVDSNATPRGDNRRT